MFKQIYRFTYMSNYDKFFEMSDYNKIFHVCQDVYTFSHKYAKYIYHYVTTSQFLLPLESVMEKEHVK